MLTTQDDIIKTLFSSVDTDKHWKLLLQQLIRSLDARSARILVLNSEADIIQNSISINHDEGYFNQYINHFVNACPWRPELSSLPKGILYSTFLDFSCDQNTFYKTEFYNDWAKPQDIAHGLCGTVFKSEKHTLQLMLQRTHGQGHFTQEEQAASNKLIPYIQQAFQLREQFKNMQEEYKISKYANSVASAPFVVLTKMGQLYYCSPSAESILKSKHSFLYISENKLHFISPSTQNEWENYLSNLKDTPKIDTFFSPQSGRGKIQLTYLPETEDAYELFKYSDPLIIWHLYDFTRITLDHGYLSSMYSLTPAECNICEALVNGESILDISTQKKVSKHTIRTQCKNILRKTGSNSQNKLISALLNGPAKQF